MPPKKNDGSELYPPGTLLRVKLGSFPEWPSMVVPDSLVAQFDDRKPTSSKLAVLFICAKGSEAYGFATPKQVRPLDSNIAEEELRNSKKKLSTERRRGYEVASKNPNLQTAFYATFGLELPEEAEQELEEVEPVEREGAGQAEEVNNANGKRQRRRIANEDVFASKRKLSQAQSRKEKPIQPRRNLDPDQPMVPSSEDREREWARRNRLVRDTRDVIQNRVVKGNFTMDDAEELEELFEELQRVPDLDGRVIADIKLVQTMKKLTKHAYEPASKHLVETHQFSNKAQRMIDLWKSMGSVKSKRHSVNNSTTTANRERENNKSAVSSAALMNS